MATTSVSSGQIVSGITISRGDRYNVDSGGSVDGATVLSGGILSGAAGAIYEGNLVIRGAISGGLLSGAGTTEVVSSGATIIGQTIGSGASATIMGSVGSASNVTISGGTLTLGTGRLNTVNVIGSSGTLILGPGGGATTLRSGNYFSSGNTAIVYSAGVLNSGNTRNGGSIILSGGTLSNTTVGDGGKLELYSGTTVNTTLQAGADVVVNSGYLLNLDTLLTKVVSSAVTIDVKSGGRLQGANIQNGGTVNVSSGGILTSSTVVSSGGLLSASNVNSGATVIIQSGGNLAGLETVASGGRLSASVGTIYSGTVTNYGFVSGGIVSGAGNTLVASGSGANSVTSGVSIQSGGVLYLGSGATGSANLVEGGKLEIARGATPSNNRFGNGTGGTIQIDSGVTWSNNNSSSLGVTSGNTLVIESGGTVSGTVILAGGTTKIAEGGIISGVQTVSSGGTLILNGTAGTGSINLAGNGAQLTISGTNMPTNTISGWSPNDKIELASIPKASIKSVTTTASGITIATTNGDYSLKVPGASTYGYELQDDGHGNTIYTTCFAEGTLIKTPSGEAAVETLAPGSMVMTPEGAMPLKWLGHRSIDVSKQINPEANWLVRICAGALADHVPARDLLVTQEHCMVFDGKLVPARMLVNGISIYLDRSINAYTYYHVELDTHMPIWAEGALTESYLDTGNRDQFENHYVTSIMSDRCEVGSDFLPLDTSRAFVEPIFRRLVDRTGLVPSVPALVDDADLHLATETGEVIRASRISGAYHMFMLPDNVETVTIASRTSRPSDVIGPFMDDRRELGVLVGEAKLFCAYKTVSLNVTETSLARKGWYESDALGRRWTNGAASLHIGSATQGEPRMLTLQILSQGPYLREVQQTVLRATA
ncbi:hypothetical protein D5366_11430 (plasmid) [Neokomagataea tanensis]|uniref:Hedgehog/Intein (Hint) domain-containing protein n=2 Tax=Neokomagataea TaxID=1223423 RepID=A0A4Y6VBX0_9PROT|nr:Hint domain-containing protein [Neokomagataea tanensis]QDH26031.1 hypothetical protein D5366_11430 [Neokomagataea tanensis]